MNATHIATTSLVGIICDILGISKPKMYYTSDYMRFMQIIEEINLSTETE